MEPSRTTQELATETQTSGQGWKGKRVGRFKLLGLLGQGAMGKVFRAEDTTLHRQVALKALPRVVRTRSYTIRAEQLIREARSAAAIEHPHVVQIYEAGESNGVFYIAMELVEGGTIHELVRAAGPLDPQRACQIVAEAAEALDYAHRLGIVHRDIKPSNLMLTRSGRCKVVDFGLARVEDAEGTFVPLGETVGTAYFVAPEVISGGQATAQSDVYSLAATLYLLLAGRVPYDGESKAKVLQQHVSAPPPDLASVRPDLPESLVKLVARGLAKGPDERFDSAGQFAKAVRVYTIQVGSGSGLFVPQTPPVSGEVSPPPAPPAVAPAPKRRIPYAVAAAALGVGIAVAAVAAFLVSHGGSKSPAPSGQEVSKVTPPVITPTIAPAAPDHGVAAKPTPDAPPTSVPTPPVRAVPSPAAAGAVDATDTAMLMRIAQGQEPAHRDRRVVVEGSPVTAEPSSSGKVFRIEFSGPNGDDGLLAVYFPGDDMFARMDKKFGGKGGSGFAGKRLRIRGQVEVYESRPEIRISNPDQIEAIP